MRRQADRHTDRNAYGHRVTIEDANRVTFEDADSIAVGDADYITDDRYADRCAVDAGGRANRGGGWSSWTCRTG
jgi:hypothetical protein